MCNAFHISVLGMLILCGSLTARLSGHDCHWTLLSCRPTPTVYSLLNLTGWLFWSNAPCGTKYPTQDYGNCRISPTPCFLTECHQRPLNQGCLNLLYCLLFGFFCLCCVFSHMVYFCQCQQSDSLRKLLRT